MKKKITLLTLLAATTSNIFCAASSTSKLMQRTKYLIAAGAGYWVSKNDPDNNLGKLAEQCVNPLIKLFETASTKIQTQSEKVYTPEVSTSPSQENLTKKDESKEEGEEGDGKRQKAKKGQEEETQ
jgi:hypothetical protein